MLAVERSGSGSPVLCLHGWPGGVSDYRLLTPLLVDVADVVVPHLPGFGKSFSPGDELRPPSDFDRAHLVRALVELITELDLGPTVIVGYDIGITTAIALAREIPRHTRALVLGNTLAPSVTAEAVLSDRYRPEFWYQDFHQLELARQLVDGNPAAVRTYLEHFWSHWGARPDAVVDESLVEDYSRPGAFTTSINWYRSGSSSLYTALDLRGVTEFPPPVDVPATVLWGAQDPIFPPEYAAAVPDLLPRADVRVLDDVGHFTPIEAAAEMAEAVRSYL
ncbi:alpha/beta fold hydrolase [Actinomycetospora termitidis]|uniref:Alpha/beta hydrolase n=1 Tax=Actinomycetospora termitidis TaxID=3053470 RepID=A0ABT7MHW5_9PSEU|nr:alpha/beta hydrolase [Actinomycetospora sp. Odt1-22]MDL5160246.1 alpha/beta hydrolase [Actinomycetospora sp. Odt1-22]